MPDAEKVWRIAAVASESADGSSYSVVAADGNGEVEVTSFRMICYESFFGNEGRENRFAVLFTEEGFFFFFWRMHAIFI